MQDSICKKMGGQARKQTMTGRYYTSNMQQHKSINTIKSDLKVIYFITGINRIACFV